MNLNRAMNSVVTGIRRHPWRAAAICVPVVAVSVFTGTTVASARPQPVLAVPASAFSAAPAAHVLTFGKDANKVVTNVKPGAVQVKEPWNVDGCDHDYGTPNQCVPWTIPVPAGKACAWLQSMGFGPLQVVGTNRQHLPENAQGYACASNA
jgi:hypothetical protein